jgi:hypothetical protein
MSKRRSRAKRPTGRLEHVDGLTTVVRLALVIGELVQVVVRDHLLGGGLGKILLQTLP